MPKKILIMYYSQSGQLKEILEKVSEAFADRKEEYALTYYPIQLKKDFPFPWKSDVFYNTFPESFLQIPSEILPPPPEVLNQKFDLILFGYQVWFLTPSIPIISFLKSQYARKILENTPIVTLSGTRNMWMLSQEKLKKYFLQYNAKLVGNIALVDRHNNYTSVVTIVNWLMKGKKTEQPPFFPPAGVAQKEINESKKYGNIIIKYCEKNSYLGMQDELVKNGAVEIRPFLVKVETIGNKIFSIFANKIMKNPSKRKLWVTIYKYYLFFAIWIISPIVLFFFVITTPLFSKKRKEQIKYHQGI